MTQDKPLWLRWCYSHNPFQVFIFVYLPAVTFFLWLGQGLLPQTGVVCALLVGGVALWSLAEYVLHRFFFHWQPKNPWLRQRVEMIHMNHHEAPDDFTILNAGPVFAFANTSIFFLISLIFTAGYYEFSAILMVGAYTGYFLYEYVHYSVHANKPRKGIMGFLCRYHMFHHHRNNKMCFGVTTPFWDKVFGTRGKVS